MQWNLSEYNNDLHVRSSDIWTPDLLLNTS